MKRSIPFPLPPRGLPVIVGGGRDNGKNRIKDADPLLNGVMDVGEW
jgi:hypothetical protein